MLTTLLSTRAAMPATDVGGRTTTRLLAGAPRLAPLSCRLAAVSPWLPRSAAR